MDKLIIESDEHFKESIGLAIKAGYKIPNLPEKTPFALRLCNDKMIAKFLTKGQYKHPNGFMASYYPSDEIIKTIKQRRKRRKNIRSISLFIDKHTLTIINPNKILISV